MKRLLCILFVLLSVTSIKAQGDIFLPVIFKGSDMAIDPQLVITDGNIRVDLLQGGWKLADPYWNPSISQYKAGGTFVNSQLAEGRRMVYQEYDNVIETIPLSLRGSNQAQAMATAHDALALLRQAGDYWTESYEYDQVWIEVKLPCNACLTGYSRVVKGTIPELTNPFGQPFFTNQNESVMEGITLTIEREPFWQITQPGTIIGPLYNLIDNPDFELWNFGVEDSQPDSWDNLETTHIAGANSRFTDLPKFGNAAIKIRVSGSTLAGATKGVSQVINDTKDNTTYTVIAWVRSEGVSNGVGRILVNYSDQLELYRSGSSHGWTLYTGIITTGLSDVVGISCEILATSANTDGTIYVDSLMFIEGDWRQEAADNVLPYLSGSHIVNHQSPYTAGAVNYLDAWYVPGNVDSLIRLEFQNNSLPSDLTTPVEIYKQIRIGLRRTKDIFSFDNYTDLPGESDTTGSNNDRITTAIAQAWSEVASKIIQNPLNTINNQGRFRVLARVYDTKSTGPSNLSVRLRYFIGSAGLNNKILDGIAAQINTNWTMIDVTRNVAMNQDTKHRTVLGQMGYAIELMRDTGSDNAYLDYILIMPTDGGYIDAQLPASLRYKDALSIDNTTGALNIEGVDTVDGFTEIVDTAGTQRGGMVYKGAMYFYSDTTGANNVVSRIKNRVKEDVLDFGDSGFGLAMAIYNGRLFIHSDHKFYSTDGSQFPGTLEFEIPFVSAGLPQTAISFDGKLFVNEGSAPAKIYEFDGTNLTESASIADSTSSFTSFAIYRNKLYASLDLPPRIYEYDPTSGAWTLQYQFVDGTDRPQKLLVFQDKLYASVNLGGVSFNTAIYVFDGSQWSNVATLDDISVPFSMASLADNILVVGGVGSGADFAAPMYQSSDGVTFTEIYNITPVPVYALVEFEGGIYILNGRTGTATLYAIIFNSSSFTVTNFEGRQFLAPSRKNGDVKRHRYFFNYDRENFINNIDDKALIGLGFVPRYLEIPMKEN